MFDMSETSENDSLLSELEKYVLVSIWLHFSNQPKAKVGYYELFKYASTFEIIIFIVGISCSALVGVLFSIAFVLYSDIVNNFVSPLIGNFKNTIQKLAILGTIKFVVAFLQMFCLQYCARRQARRIRQLLFSVGFTVLIGCSIKIGILSAE